MNKHPKWIIKYVHKSKIHAVNIVNWEDHHHIATIPHVFNWTDGKPSEGKEAAELIAAAPELLEALIRASDHLLMSEGCFVIDGKVGQSTDWKEALDQARAAIAKATE